MESVRKYARDVARSSRAFTRVNVLAPATKCSQECEHGTLRTCATRMLHLPVNTCEACQPRRE